MKTKYKSPPFLDRVIEWQQETADQVPYLETPTGLHLGIDFHEKEGYFCTPVDDRDSDWFDHRRWQREKAIVGKHAQKAFKFAPIDRAFRYIQDIRQVRQAAVSIMTDEMLGVMPLQKSGLSGQEVKLAAVRNLQAEACSDRVLVERSARDLIQMGLAMEAEKLCARLLG